MTIYDVQVITASLLISIVVGVMVHWLLSRNNRQL